MNRSRSVLAAALAGTTVLVPAAMAGAEPNFTAMMGDQPVEDSSGSRGTMMTLSAAGCINPDTNEAGWIGQYVSDQGSPLTHPNFMTSQLQVQPDGTHTEDVMIPMDAGLGTFYSVWFCSFGPSDTITDPEWTSDVWTFTVMSADARGQLMSDAVDDGSVVLHRDADALPTKDLIGIHGDVAAGLKADVDAVYPQVAQVQRLYSAFLGRTADNAGIEYWTGQIEQGVSLRKIAARMAGSAEFRNGRGQLGDSAFVDAMYRSILGRGADSAGRAFWLDRLAAGESRSSVALAFANSRENQAKTANLSYVVAAHYALGAPVPGRAALQDRVDQLDAGTLKVTVVEEVALTVKSASAWMA